MFELTLKLGKNCSRADAVELKPPTRHHKQSSSPSKIEYKSVHFVFVWEIRKPIKLIE